MRQYVALEKPGSNGRITVSGKDYRYFSQVLRLGLGDRVQVRLPHGILQDMSIVAVDDKSRCIILAPCADSVPIAPDEHSGEQIDYWLFQFIAKSNKMDLIIRQATECGVGTIIPVMGSFSQSAVSGRNFRGDRTERIIREAREQSGSPVATKVCDAVTVEEACALWTAHCHEVNPALSVVLYERVEGTVPLHRLASNGGEIRTAALAVGAEGGISSSEIKILQLAGFIPVHFETNILRCETAALYGLAAVQAVLMENSVWQCKE
jgi:16S rRNA (uracil1498-N3)-methyltransferase